MKKAVVFTGLVNVDKNLVGTAVIYIKMAEILSRENYQVHLVVPEVSDYNNKKFKFHLYDKESNEKLINSSSLVVFGAYPPIDPMLYAYRKKKNILTYLWSIAPIGSLEFRDFPDFDKQFLLHQYITTSYNLSLLLSDKIFCRSDKVRDLVLGSLISLGRANLENYRNDKKISFLEVSPFGIDSSKIEHKKNIYRGRKGIDKKDFLLIWNGGIWNWNDGVTLIKAMNELKDKKIKLIFQGYRHPNKNQKLSDEAQKTIRLAKKLGLIDKNVFFIDTWQAYEERGNYLSECDAGIVTSPNIPEANYFLKTRIYDYIWAELPIIANDCEAYSGIIQANNLGIVAKTGDHGQLAKNILNISQNKKALNIFRKNLKEYKKDIAWRKTLQPVVEYVRNPEIKKDKYNKKNLLLQKSIDFYTDLYSKIEL